MKVRPPHILRQQLKGLVDQARLNERKLRRFQDLELRMIGATSLFDLLDAVIYPGNARFKWDRVTLLLLDPEYELRRVLEEEGFELAEHPALVFETDLSGINCLFPPPLSPMLEPYREGKHHRLFDGPNESPSSVILLPLLRRQQLIGSLNIGSFSADRFVRGMSTDFLEHFAAVVALCLENAANVERLKSQGLTDTLTGVNNRRFFDQRLTEEIAAAQRDRLPLACLMLDIDYFKAINDNHGHQTGDRALMKVAALIRTQLRGSDVLARYGGEEFATLLPDTDETSALEVAERIRENIAKSSFTYPGNTAFNVTASIGVAVFDPANELKTDTDCAEQLVGRADEGLYKCKAAGRNRVISGGIIGQSLGSAKPTAGQRPQQINE